MAMNYDASHLKLIILSYKTIIAFIVLKVLTQVYFLIKNIKTLDGNLADLYLRTYYSNSSIMLLVIIWCMVAIAFVNDISTKQKWATGLVGYLVGMTAMVSFPYGTILGLYTVWCIKYKKINITEQGV